VEIREKYLSVFADKKDFVDYMATWVKEPKQETSLMLDAIAKYEIMPNLSYELDSLRDISAYIYDTDFVKTYGGH